MSFELTNVLTMCQEIINNALQQYLNQFVITYLNNIIIYSKTLKEHISYVFKILECLNIKNLHFKLKKCEFYQKKINFLRFVVKRHKVRMNLKKLRAIKK